MAIYYVNLGVDTDAQAQIAGGTGTIGDPFNARGPMPRGLVDTAVVSDLILS